MNLKVDETQMETPWIFLEISLCRNMSKRFSEGLNRSLAKTNILRD